RCSIRGPRLLAAGLCPHFADCSEIEISAPLLREASCFLSCALKRSSTRVRSNLVRNARIGPAVFRTLPSGDALRPAIKYRRSVIRRRGDEVRGLIVLDVSRQRAISEDSIAAGIDGIVEIMRQPSNEG